MCFKMFFRKLGGIHNSMNIYSKYLIRGLPVLHSSLRCSGESHPKIVVRWIHQAAKSKKIKDVGPMGFFLLLVPVTTFGLGTWQVQRRKWKIGLIKELEEITTALPIDLPQNLQELQNMEYQKVKVRGKFDHSQEIYITPRSLLKEGGEGDEGGLLSSGQSGTLVITPLMLTDRDVSILVNRGWVSRKRTPPAMRKEGQVEGEVEIVGIVRNSEKRAPFGAKNDPNSRFYHYRDVDNMARFCGTAPVFLDATDESSVPGGPIGGQTKVSLRNEHFSYILTWYSLSALTSFMWYRRFVRGLPLM